MQIIRSRRHFLAGLSAAGAAGLVGAATPASAEPPPETRPDSPEQDSGICLAPQFVAEDLLYAEGFTHMDYVETQPGTVMATDTASGKIDFGLNFIAPIDCRRRSGAQADIVGRRSSGLFRTVRPARHR